MTRTRKEHRYMHSQRTSQPDLSAFLRSRTGIVLVVFLAVAAFYLTAEHAAHVFGLLPYGLILLCPIMHLLMHRGHGGHGDHSGHEHRAAHPAERTEGDER